MRNSILTLIFFYSVAYGQYSNFNSNKISESFFKTASFHQLMHSEEKTDASQNFDVTYYRCEWKTDPAIRFISGAVTSYFKITSAADSIAYDLSDSLKVDSVKERNFLLPFSQQNNTLQIEFNEKKSVATIDSVTVYYRGSPPSSGFGSFVNSTHNNIPVMWTLSEPYGSRDWWPCKNGLDDKADSIDVYINSPSQYRAVSNGLLQSETIDRVNKITHWRHRYPIASYLVCMAVTNYVEFKNFVQIENTNLLMQTFCYPENLGLFQSKTPLVLASLQFFSKIFGPYPFIKEKYGHVQFGWGGGQEHQTSTFLVRPDEVLMAHELAHQWFGDKITCGSWQHIWINEGLATHLASMDMESKYPLSVTDTRKKEIETITSLPGGSVFVDDTTNVSRIFNSRLTYLKGSHLLYMLRWIMTDSIFIKGMKNYFNDSSISYGFATTSDLQRNLEAASGMKLDYFFNDWFYGQGYPTYHISWSQLGNSFVKIKMDQTTSHPSVSFFALPVALQFKNATQQKTIVVNNKTNGEIFLKNIGFVADTVIIDPDYWLITKDNTSQKVNDEVSGKNVIQIFPNPFKGNIDVYLRNFDPDKIFLKIFDSKGSLVLKNEFNVNQSTFIEFNTQQFLSGIYFIKIQTANGVKFVKKIVKQ